MSGRSSGLLCALLTAASCDPGDTGALDLFSAINAPEGGPRDPAVPEDAAKRDAGCDPETAECASDCREDRDCESGSSSRCLVARGVCVECLDAADCSSGSRSLCDPARHACVECTVDADCTEPDKPGCLALEGRCEECSIDAHCQSGEICSLTEGQCR